ncbi:MAG: AraC family transcriptional regulator [Chloroflexota bacterium]|nr:MAG: AraC family transcriptional regulator [Chloroflexota bacterium]
MDFVVADRRSSDSSLVEMIWRTRSDREGAFMSTANIHWEIVLAKYRDRVSITVRGPETRASLAHYPADAEWLGITFRLGTFMPAFPLNRLTDRRDVELRVASGNTFWLNGAVWEFPTYENADTFVKRLVREELLVYDPVVDAVLQGRSLDLSPRAIQYRFQRATGLTYSKVQQIERARRAAALLESGHSILDTVSEADYFDQSHLTNSLKRFIGQTPGRMVRALASG